MVEQTLIEELIGAIKQDPKMRNRTHSAVVARVDDEGVVWVYVAGSDQETPTATTSAEVKRGDGVMVEWRNDRLYIVGNTTDPSAGKARVQAVEDAAAKAGAAASRALTAAASAEESAETAATAAAKAVEDADKAGKAAAEADQKAVAAGTAADNAQKSANIAQESAHNASEYAARALGNLSTVQSVTETLNWITTHGTMTKTDDYAPSTDTEVIEGKKYYSRSGSGTAQDPYVYTLISNPTGDPSASGYYEGVLDPTHVYFVQDNAGDYEVAGVRYAIVTEPKVEDIADYYVLSIDESLNNYVATHLALLNDGLYVMADDSEWKVKITDNGVFILDPNNKAANSMMADKNIVGYTDKAHIEIDNQSLNIYDNYRNLVAEFKGLIATIGLKDYAHLTLSSRGVKAYNNDNILFFDVDYLGGLSPIIEYYNESFTDQGTLLKEENIKTLPNALFHEADSIEKDGTQIVAYLRGNTEIISVDSSSDNINTEVLPPSPQQYNAVAVATLKQSINIPWSSGTEIYYVCTCQDKTTGQTFRLRIYHKMTKGNKNTWETQIEKLDNYNEDIQFGIRDWVYLGDTIITTAPSITFGLDSGETKGNYSARIGECLIAEEKNQTVIGAYNTGESSTIFEIGNGTENNARSNALTVDWDGNIETALDTSAAAGTIDGDLYAAITALGWESEVID